MKRTSIADLDLSDPNNPKLVHLNRGVVKQNLQDFGKSVRVLVTYETYRRKRTVNQNSTLHWYINEISEESGLDTDTVKDVLKKRFLTVALLDKEVEIMADNNGEVLERVKNTSELTTVEFNEFTEKIRMWANEYLGLQLPLPNEESELKFKNQ